jgi:hypothetical protein
MGRAKRVADGGFVYHVLNRSNARLRIFDNEGDYEAFERVLEEAVERFETRLLAYCVLSNHWHLVVWPREDGELAALRRCVTRGCPYGEEPWCDQMVQRLGLESTIRPQGRPKKTRNGS